MSLIRYQHQQTSSHSTTTGSLPLSLSPSSSPPTLLLTTPSTPSLSHFLPLPSPPSHHPIYSFPLSSYPPPSHHPIYLPLSSYPPPHHPIPPSLYPPPCHHPIYLPTSLTSLQPSSPHLDYLHN
ncbi:hypothetical protein Pmani_039372 [Petrolisthes manimaculis]|uniref:Uncharacterized protein n=1 Tax=Petrolisthes manimaculis TaxID=1843537 RepID=A0AAE1NCY4_9EUCA|nr:hypothetical protein Pmani_039372 [Petrolisthes manimaculis]